MDTVQKSNNPEKVYGLLIIIMDIMSDIILHELLWLFCHRDFRGFPKIILP
jgi:hypothetical protein